MNCLYQNLDRVPGGQGDGFVFIFKLQFSPPRICHRTRDDNWDEKSTDNASVCTRELLISIVKTTTSTIHFFWKHRVERGNTVIDSLDSTCVIGTRLLFDKVTYKFQIFPELNFKKNKASFHCQFSCQIPEVFLHWTWPIYQLIWNKTRTTDGVLLYYNVFPILCLNFVGISCTVTRAVIGSSTPRFTICQHFSSQKRKQ